MQMKVTVQLEVPDDVLERRVAEGVWVALAEAGYELDRCVETRPLTAGQPLIEALVTNVVDGTVVLDTVFAESSREAGTTGPGRDKEEK